MSQEIVEAVRVLGREKGISEEKLMEALEDALLSAYKKTPGAAKYARVTMDRESADFRVDVTVRFFSPYLGRQLSFRSVANPKKLLCYSGNGDSSSCLERFVGALAVVNYRFQVRRKQAVAAASFREVVKVVAQADGLDSRPPYLREVPLVKGQGTDIQAFGYDESSVPEAEREAWKKLWADVAALLKKAEESAK